MDTTIAAISTAYGEAGIGIVRMSGPNSLDIAKTIFKAAGSGFACPFYPRHMYYGSIIDPESGNVIDEVLCVYMKAPHTYTAEDLVEIQSHGSMLSLKSILELCLRFGAELAQPGEFTKRAFINGRMDLSQAEAVIDLIKAKTEKGYDVAIGQMQGKLSFEVNAIREELLDVLVELTVNMDYPDEDIEVLTYEKLKANISLIYDRVLRLMSSAGEGKLLREGLSITIAGKPNVGKSSLMNAFLGEARSIVTDVPGTTRDTIEEQVSVRGIPIRFTDTAGIHKSDDEVESIGIERSKNAFNKADLILLVMDASRSLSIEDAELLDMLAGRQAIVVLNKTDLPMMIQPEDITADYPGTTVVCAAIKDGLGIEELKDAVEFVIGGGKIRRNNDIIINNIRHENLIRKAAVELSQALAMISVMEAMDFIEVNVRAAFEFLGEILGETVSDDVINEVFSRFCLGK